MNAMYQIPFKYKKKKRFTLKGRFALSYMGQGIFYYTLPGPDYPIVGKIELTRPKSGYLGGLILLATLGFFTLHWRSDFSKQEQLSEDVSASASSEEDLKRLEKEGRFEELDEQSEEAKSRLYTLHKPVTSLPPSSNRLRIKKYRVREGDTLSEIAARYEIPATIIAATSKIKYNGVLMPGQELLVPNKPGLMYELKKGETLAAILHKYRIDIAAFQKANPAISKLDMLEEGQEIFLPNAHIPIPPLRWIRPVRGRFTSRYGWRRHPIHRRRHFHTGVDIAARYKSVRAVRSGRVVYAGYLGAYGKVVVIRHNKSFKSLYAHLSRIRTRVGRLVQQGRIIGVTGNTGRSTGPHLHFEIIRNGRPVNPLRYVRF